MNTLKLVREGYPLNFTVRVSLENNCQLSPSLKFNVTLQGMLDLLRPFLKYEWGPLFFGDRFLEMSSVEYLNMLKLVLTGTVNSIHMKLFGDIICSFGRGEA